jgi:hypothetical protein
LRSVDENSCATSADFKATVLRNLPGLYASAEPLGQQGDVHTRARRDARRFKDLLGETVG